MKKSSIEKSVGTYSAGSEGLFRIFKGFSATEVNDQVVSIFSDGKVYELSCFLRIESENTTKKWTQGSGFISRDKIEWKSYWQKKTPPIVISEEFKIKKLFEREKSLLERFFRFKPMFTIIRGDLAKGGFIEFAVTHVDLFLFIQGLILNYGKDLEVESSLVDEIADLRIASAHEKSDKEDLL